MRVIAGGVFLCSLVSCLANPLGQTPRAGPMPGPHPLPGPQPHYGGPMSGPMPHAGPAPMPHAVPAPMPHAVPAPMPHAAPAPMPSPIQAAIPRSGPMPGPFINDYFIEPYVPVVEVLEPELFIELPVYEFGIYK